MMHGAVRRVRAVGPEAAAPQIGALRQPFLFFLKFKASQKLECML